MRFSYAKKEGICHHCKGEIKRGDFCTRTFFSPSEGVNISLLYHYNCYPEHFLEQYRESAVRWANEQQPPKKLGRPRKYRDGKYVNQLKALERYHRLAGHTEQAEQVRTKIANVTNTL